MRFIKFNKQELKQIDQLSYDELDDFVDKVIETRKQAKQKSLKNLWQNDPTAKHPKHIRNTLRDQLIVLEVEQRATRGRAMKLYDELARDYQLSNHSIRYILYRMKKNPS